MSVALTSVERINALKNGIEATTGETYADLTEGVQALKNGYGQGGGGGTEEIENIIDESGVLESTDGTATEKVEQLIDKAQFENILYEQSKSWSNQFASLFNNNQDIKKIPRLNFQNASTMQTCFNACVNLESVDYYINSSKCTNFTSLFTNCTKLKYIKGVDTSKATRMGGFINGSGVETIDSLIDMSNVQSTHMNAFTTANNLVNVSFVAESIKYSLGFGSAVLSDESIQSIIDGLATVETAQTLTLHADVKTKLTDEQLATITSKNWSVA